MLNIWISMFSYVENPFLGFLRLFEAFLTSYDATQRKKTRQFMYDFKKISKISSFCYLKMANIWISMFSYVENPFLRFLRLLEVFLTSYDATPRAACTKICDLRRAGFLNKSLIRFRSNFARCSKIPCSVI